MIDLKEDDLEDYINDMEQIGSQIETKFNNRWDYD